MYVYCRLLFECWSYSRTVPLPSHDRMELELKFAGLVLHTLHLSEASIATEYRGFLENSTQTTTAEKKDTLRTSAGEIEFWIGMVRFAHFCFFLRHPSALHRLLFTSLLLYYTVVTMHSPCTTAVRHEIVETAKKRVHTFRISKIRTCVWYIVNSFSESGGIPFSPITVVLCRLDVRVSPWAKCKGGPIPRSHCLPVVFFFDSAATV